jgi:hypothetical protein
MPQASEVTEYRGYMLSSAQRARGWRVNIYPGSNLLPTQPDSVSATLKKEALTKARAIIDHQLSSFQPSRE